MLLNYNMCYYRTFWSLLRFMSGRGSALTSANEGKSGFIYNLVNKLFKLPISCESWRYIQ